MENASGNDYDYDYVCDYFVAVVVVVFAAAAVVVVAAEEPLRS